MGNTTKVPQSNEQALHAVSSTGQKGRELGFMRRRHLVPGPEPRNCRPSSLPSPYADAPKFNPTNWCIESMKHYLAIEGETTKAASQQTNKIPKMSQAFGFRLTIQNWRNSGHGSRRSGLGRRAGGAAGKSRNAAVRDRPGFTAAPGRCSVDEQGTAPGGSG